MIPPNSPAPSSRQIACKKKAPEGAFYLLLFLLMLERVLHAERDSGHVRACNKPTRGTAARRGSLRCRAGDVVVIRAHRAVPAVVDFGVGDEHLGALGH